MKIKLRVDVEGYYWKGGAVVEVPDFLNQAFEPLKVCDDRLVPVITGDIVAETEDVRVVLKMRDDAADKLAKTLSVLIIKEMSKNDTSNDYNDIPPKHKT